MEVSIGIWRLIDYGDSLARVKAVNASTSRITEHLRKCICEFQLEYTNYQFLVSIFHRDFKEAFANNPDNSHKEYLSFRKIVLPKSAMLA